jgi:starch synthase
MSGDPRILFLSPEAVPFAKTGGLADVSGALPAALEALGVDVRLVLPFYRTVREKGFKTGPPLKDLSVPLGKESLRAHVFETRTEEGLPVYLVEREDLYDRPNLYGNAGGDYYDNLERFTFFCHAALRLTTALSFHPDVIHCHDWQTGLVPALVQGPYKNDPDLAGTPAVFTVHNLGYQGIFPADRLPVTGLSRDDFFHVDGLEFWGSISLLKAGIVYSDVITTVSPAYSREIQTPEYGMGMEGVLKKRRASLHGILNGIDYRIWNPATDAHISANYSPGRMAGKGRCKDALISEMGLDPSLAKRPILGMISRLDAQKGLDLLVEILDDILALDAGLVVLGSGDEEIQQALRETSGRYPGRVGLFLGLNEPLAHRIMAGVDLFLIPSRYEPCGLTQMYALKYGTVPVVRATGGLDDTVIPYDPGTRTGNGLKFGPYRPEAFLAALREAVDLFQNKRLWKGIVAGGMKADFSWDRSAGKYLKLYETLIRSR